MTARIPLPSDFESTPFSHADGLAAGLGKSRLRSADLVRPYHGVRHPAEMPLDVEARCRAFLIRMPADAFFCSVTAAVLRGLPLPTALERSTLLHVAVPAPRRSSAARGVIGHKLRVAAVDVGNWRGLPLSSPERTWCELGEVLQLADLVAAGDYLIHWSNQICSHAALLDADQRFAGRRGAPVRRRALELMNDRAESPQESRLRVLLTQSRFSGFTVNQEIRVRGRRFRADLAFPERKLLLEYQGDYHRDAEQWRRDMTRDSILASDGWFTLQINAEDMHNPTELSQRIRFALRSRPRIR